MTVTKDPVTNTKRNHNNRAIQFDGVDMVSITEESADRKLGSGEIRVAPQYIGICGSDLHVLAGKHPFAKAPTVPGHEMCAIITEIAPDVKNVNIGDHIVVDPIMACGNCRACRSGQPNLCEPPNVAGFRAPGFARTSHIVPAKNAHVAPKDVPWQILAFTEPATCARHAVGRLPNADREDVLMIGAGNIGLAILQALRIVGAGKITVIEPDPAKRLLAEKFGADRTVEPGKLTDERFTGVIDVVAAQGTLIEACTRVIAGGTIVVMGVPDGDRSIPLASMQRFERTLTSSGMYVPSDFDDAIAWLGDGRFDPRDLITDVFPIDQAAKAYERAKEPDSIKVLIHIGNEE